MLDFMQDSGEWWRPVSTIVGSIIVGLVVHWVAFAALRLVAAKTDNETDDLMVQYSREPARIIIPVILLFMVLPGTALAPESQAIVSRIAAIALIIGIAWLVLAAMNFTATVVRRRFDITQSDNLIARRMHTQVDVIRKIGTVVVIFLACAAALMTFPSLRAVGFSLFASAGAAGLIVGLAARPTLSNLIAGLQIALTDPIRIDDVVIVEGEWGWIEEINTTYVVVRIWDLRRLIVPLTHFIEKPFENWTRRSADILGTVFLYADYTVPVEEVRAELRRIVEGSELWDGEVCGLQVTNATERTVELRALVSAATSPAAWDLRCMVRERMIEFLKEQYPESLPRIRAEFLASDQYAGPGSTPAVAA